MNVVTRFAPSPTGYLHLGSARTALFCYLFSRHHKGKFLLRFEDTDKQRSQQTYVDAILAAMEWLGINWDEEPSYQSQRYSLYDEAIQRLLAEGNAYRCLRTPAQLAQLREQQLAQGKKPKYDGYYRDKNIGPDAKDFVVRFKNPLKGKAQFKDLIRGTIEIENEELDDLVIARADGSPTYNLCAVVDDIAMGITHILRGDDHLVNSLRQINIYQALKAEPPKFTHLPMILNSDNQRLSKRDSAQDIRSYQQQGILPEALRSYIARLGWSSGDKELFTQAELIALFDINKIQTSPAHFAEDKLLWVNQQFIHNMPLEKLTSYILTILKQKSIKLSPQLPIDAIVALHRPRANTLLELADDIVFYCVPPSSYETAQHSKHITAATASRLLALQQQFNRCDPWSAEAIKKTLNNTASSHQLRFPQLAMPLRLALCGKASSPAIAEVAALLGAEETKSRLKSFIQSL